MKTAEELAALRQEMKDFKGEIFPKLKEITDQTKKTNGSIARVITEQRLIKDRQDNCPARNYHQSPSKLNEQDWSIRKAAIIIGAITVLFLGLLQIAIATLNGKI